MTITVGATLIVFILGLIAIVVAVVKEKNFSSTFFYLTAFWVFALAMLGGIVVR